MLIKSLLSLGALEWYFYQFKQLIDRSHSQLVTGSEALMCKRMCIVRIWGSYLVQRLAAVSDLATFGGRGVGGGRDLAHRMTCSLGCI